MSEDTADKVKESSEDHSGRGWTLQADVYDVWQGSTVKF